jgi:hypothetical protein
LIVRLPLIIIFIFFLLKAKSQTTIVVQSFTNEIIVGADSYSFIAERKANSEKVDTIVIPRCKIYQFGTVHVALAGYFGATVPDKIARISSTIKGFDGISNHFATQFEQLLVDSLKIMRSVQPTLFNELAKDEGFSEIIFFGFENGKKRIFVLSFYVYKITETNIVVSHKVQHVNDYLTGHTCHTKQEYLATVHNWKRSNAVAHIERIIYTEAKYHPKEVGPPIDLVRVTPKGTQWLKRKAICE